MYDALEVSRHIINYCNSHNYSVSNLKLQKLLYFVQAYFLIASPKKNPCFVEEIEAWDFGPVVPKVYSEFKQFGSTDIPTLSFYYENSDGNFFKTNLVKFEDNKISKEDKILINDVVENFKKYTATDLVKLTHNQEPWLNAYHKGGNKIIKIESIRNYFDEK